jgi:hypothetical protein
VATVTGISPLVQAVRVEKIIDALRMCGGVMSGSVGFVKLAFCFQPVAMRVAWEIVFDAAAVV